MELSHNGASNRLLSIEDKSGNVLTELQNLVARIAHLVHTSQISAIDCLIADMRYRLRQESTEMMVGLLRYTSQIKHLLSKWDLLRDEVYEELIIRNLNPDITLKGLLEGFIKNKEI